VPSKSTRKRSSKRSTSRTSAAKRKSATSKSAAKRGSSRGGVASPARPSAGISRIDQPSRRTHGYFVRVGYRMTSNGSRPSASAYFGDASHGSRRKAWEAAEAWLKKTRRSL
jgi:hypothetical protein